MVRCRSEPSSRRGRNGFGVSGRLSGHRRVPPPPAITTAYIGRILSAQAPRRAGSSPAASERGWRDAEQDARDARPGIGIAVRDARSMRDGVAGLEPVVLRSDPQVEGALEDEDDLLIRVMGVGL